MDVRHSLQREYHWFLDKICSYPPKRAKGLTVMEGYHYARQAKRPLKLGRGKGLSYLRLRVVSRKVFKAPRVKSYGV